MDTLDRYLVREFLTYFILLLIGLSSIYLGIDLFSKFWKINLPAEKVFLLYLYKSPHALQQFLPVACLMASLLILTNMSTQNEILALYSGGIGTLRVSSTFIAIVALICTIAFLTFDRINPVFEKKQYVLQTGKDENSPVTHYDPTKFWYRSGRLVYNVGWFSPEENKLENLNVYMLNANFDLVQRIWAKTALYRDNNWTLYDGFVITYSPTTHYPVATEYKEKKGIIPEKPSDFRTLSVREETMMLKELRKYIARNKGYGLDTTRSQVLYHERIAFVFTPLIFVLLAIPFGTHPLRTHSVGRSIGLCFLLVFIYLLLFRFSLTVGKGGHLPPQMAAWLPNGLFLLYAGYQILKR